MSVLIGGEKAYLVRQIKDFIISYQWLDNEPTMFIARSDRFALGNRPTTVVRMEDCHRYTDKRNNPTEQLFIYAYQSAEYLGFIGDYAIKQAAKNIVTIILDGIPELLEMPDEPTNMTKQQGERVGEMLIKVDGKTIFENEVTVPQGMSS